MDGALERLRLVLAELEAERLAGVRDGVVDAQALSNFADLPLKVNLGDSVRVSPHVYNTFEDIDRFVAAGILSI